MEYCALLENVSKEYDVRKPYIPIPPITDIPYTVKYWWKKITGRHDVAVHKVRALENLSISIAPGDIVGIIGRNGSGKTTTCKLISKRISPSSGKVSTNGRVVYSIDMRDGYRYYQTLRESIYSLASMFGVRKSTIKNRFDQIVDFSEMEEFIDRYVSEFSAGMIVRLHLSVAIHVEPDILIVDELLSVANVEFRNKCFSSFNKLNINGTTIILVSHDLDIMQKLCNKVILLDEGRVVHIGDARVGVIKYNDILNKLSVNGPILSNRKARSMQVSTRKLKVFLCHSSGDKSEVKILYNKLLSIGLDPWLDVEKILPGQDWELEIAIAVRSSDVVLVCLSNNSINKKGYVQKEIKYALDTADEQPEGTIFIIPIKLEECNVPERLKRWQWVEYFKENGYESLVKSLHITLAIIKVTSGYKFQTAAYRTDFS
jgi:ABC-type polysaccharide/polyol phosphate transport system ATPase subunit